MTSAVYAIEITAYDPAIATTRTLTYASGAGFNTKAADTPANTHFAPLVIEAGSFSQYLVDALVTDGRSRVGFGAIVLNNADGRLDGLKDYGFDGRRVVLRRGVPGAAYPSAWTTLFTGTMEQVEFSWGQVQVIVRDRQGEVADLPYQTTKFAGNNSLPNGVEGIADDLKGKPKPILRGKCFNISPPLVNTSKLTYQISHKTIASIDAVYSGGVAVTAGTSHASLALLQAAAPAAGTYDFYLGSASDGAYFRLGSSPTTTVTCDATEGAAAANRTAAQIAKQILLDAGVASGDISASAVSALDTANSSVIGVWSGAEESRIGDVLDEVLASIGAYWTVTSAGVFTFGRLEAPSGSPVKTFEAFELLEDDQPIERLRGRSNDKGLPAWRLQLFWQKNYTVQGDSDVQAAVTLARRGFLKEEYRVVINEDAAIKTQYLLAPEKQVYTLLTNSADAANEASRLNTLYKTKRDFLRWKCSASYMASTAIELGNVVSLQVNRFGWSSGKLLRVMGITYEFSRDEVTYEVWG
jgi:hypothetical protein